MEFKKVKLGDFIDTISDTTPIKKDKVILINTSDVENGNVLNHSYVENKNLKGQFKKRFKKGDILYSEIRPKNRRFAYIDFDADDYIASTKLMVIRNKGNINNDFLFQVLKSENIINHLQMLAETRSGTFPQITFTELSNVEIFIPIIENQEKISSFLKNIDKKIELNNKINDNLFKFAINYLNDKKEDTEVPVSKFAKIQGGYAFKSKDLIDNKTDNRIIKIKNLRSELNADVTNSQFVEDEVANNIDSKFKLNKGDVTIAMTGAELGKTGFIYGFDKYYLNQRVGVIRGENKEGDLYLKLLFLSDEFQTFLNSKGYGSAQPNISTSDIESILVNDITEKNLKDIYERLNAIYYRIISNCEENLNLEQLRDTLLPKLMNGEIDLDKIEI